MVSRIPVESSNIKSVGYDPENKLLEVEFKSGAIYHYLEVQPSIFSEFLASDSKGQFLNTRIKPSFLFIKVGPQLSYRVRWEIDIDASSPEEAARIALNIQRDVNSIATVFTVDGKDYDVGH